MTDHLAQLHAALDADPENWDLRLLGSDEIEAAGEAELAEYYRWTAKVRFRPYDNRVGTEGWLVRRWSPNEIGRLNLSDLPANMAEQLAGGELLWGRVWRKYPTRQAAELDVARVAKAFGYPALQEVK